MANTAPPRPFRIIRGEGGKYRVHYFRTQEARDSAAQRWADKDGSNVITELWSAEHPQDSLNMGWACDGHREPASGQASKVVSEDFAVVDGLPLRLSFMPDAIREHFGDEEDPRYAQVEAMTDAQLERVGEIALGDDGIYDAFHAALTWALDHA